MKKTRFEQMQEQIIKRFGEDKGRLLADSMKTEYERLCQAYKNQTEAMISHTRNNIFPVVSAFRALVAEGFEKEEAVEISRSSFLELMEITAGTIRKMLKFPGLYRLMPWAWKTLMPKLFKEDAGFRFKFYPADSSQVKFDMLACPYFRTCCELDCMELAPIFCETDDVCYGNMHPKLIWNRSKTIAKGGELCDFDLYIKK